MTKNLKLQNNTQQKTVFKNKIKMQNTINFLFSIKFNESQNKTFQFHSNP